MRVERPGPGEELNRGPESPARPAASVMVVRDSAEGPEVLLVQRNPAARFMGGAWVFPGGAVHGEETPEQAGLRETGEEAGVRLEAGELVPFSRWVTPVEVKVRFDTSFFVAAAPDGAEPKPDGAECVGAIWIRPAEALARFERGELTLVFPTIKHLEQLAKAATVAELLADARTREIVPIQPRIVASDDGARVLLPGEPGFTD